jgi:hypothetical protein
VAEHRGKAGNEKADALARKGSASTFIGCEPVFRITKATAHRSISAWIKSQHQIHWINVAGHRQSKPSQSLGADVLQLSTTQIRVVKGLKTSHCNLRKRLHTMGTFKETQAADYAVRRRKQPSTLSSNVKSWLVGGLISWGL